MPICAAKAVKRALTAMTLVEARWMPDWMTRAPSSHGASASVTSVRFVTSATSSSPPKTGRQAFDAVRLCPGEPLHERRKARVVGREPVRADAAGDDEVA